MSPDGRLCAAGSLDTIVRIWDIASGQLIERLRGHKDSVYSVAFTPNGRGLISGSLDKTLKYWDVSQVPRTDEAVQKRLQETKEGKGKGQLSPCTRNFVGHKVRWLE